MQKEYVATGVLLLSSILWGMSWWPLKSLAGIGVNELHLIFIAYSFLTVLFAPLLIKQHRAIRAHAKGLALIFLCGGLANLCFNYALIKGEVLRVMALFYLLPVWGVLGGRFILKERTSVWRWIGVVCAVVGAMIVLDVRNVMHKPPQWIDLIALASGFFFAATILLFRGVEGAGVVVKIGALFTGCAICAVIALLIFAGSGNHYAWPDLSGVLWVLAFALGWLIWANLGSQWAATVLPAGRTAIIMVMELVAAVVSAVLIGGESFTLGIAVGGALIVSATLNEVWQEVTAEKRSVRSSGPSEKPGR